MGNSMAGAISSAGDQAGAASALVGVLQFLFGTVGSGIVGLIPDTAGRTMGVVVGLLSLVAVVMMMRIRPANTQVVVAG
jgi:DHA1 family bicyclomycin/chloramphenicol resistance-like MFS transporter